MPPVTGRRVESWVDVGSREVADLAGVVDMHAAGAARTRDLGKTEVARTARGATDLERENIAITL